MVEVRIGCLQETSDISKIKTMRVTLFIVASFTLLFCKSKIGIKREENLLKVKSLMLILQKIAFAIFMSVLFKLSEMKISTVLKSIP